MQKKRSVLRRKVETESSFGETQPRHAAVANRVTGNQTCQSVWRRREGPVQETGNCTASIAASRKF